jgi:dihydroflavonol-4-reductase
MQGVDVVFHAAAVYQFFPWWKKKSPAIYKINIDGTKNVIECGKKAGIKRLVYTSSIITIGKCENDLSDENTPFDESQLSSHYARSKREAESLILREAQKGFPAVIVNPGIAIGERDSKPTPSGEVLIKFLNRAYPSYFDTIWSVCDVDDVAQGHIAASEKGRIGERYILCNREHYSMIQIFKMLEKISGVKPPFIRFPYPVLLAFTYVDEWSIKLVNHKPLLPSEAVKFCRSSLRCDSSRAVRELGYQTTPIETTLEKAVRWYRDHGYVRN